jgi:hypothetical protein
MISFAHRSSICILDTNSMTLFTYNAASYKWTRRDARGGWENNNIIYNSHLINDKMHVFGWQSLMTLDLETCLWSKSVCTLPETVLGLPSWVYNGRVYFSSRISCRLFVHDISENVTVTVTYCESIMPHLFGIQFIRGDRYACVLDNWAYVATSYSSSSISRLNMDTLTWENMTIPILRIPIILTIATAERRIILICSGREYKEAAI